MGSSLLPESSFLWESQPSAGKTKEYFHVSMSESFLVENLKCRRNIPCLSFFFFWSCFGLHFQQITWKRACFQGVQSGHWTRAIKGSAHYPCMLTGHFMHCDCNWEQGPCLASHLQRTSSWNAQTHLCFEYWYITFP